MDTLTNQDTNPVEAVADRLFGATLEGMDAVAIAIGDRLGYYRALDAGPRTPDELAAETGHSPRYTREWLEQQAMTGYVVPSGDAYALAPGVGETLARPGTSTWLAPLMRQFAAAAAQWTRIADAAASGTGLAWHEYGPDMYEAQSDMNAATGATPAPYPSGSAQPTPTPTPTAATSSPGGGPPSSPPGGGSTKK